jgi:hypothetical protein
MMQDELTPKVDQDPVAQQKFNEKRKWQIALRRYVIEKALSKPYAPYFGLDITNMRRWFEQQFTNGLNWDNFGTEWQFSHVIPVTYFDFEVDEDLKMCWNFLNLHVERIQKNQDGSRKLELLVAKRYFAELFLETDDPICEKLLQKINEIEQSTLVDTDAAVNFINTHQPYLKAIANYSPFEFELLNMGKSVEDVNNEVAIIKKFGA